MSTHRFSFKSSILFLMLGTSLCACFAKSAPARFFVLSPLPQSGPNPAEGVTVGVFPVAMPDYLDRPQIVNRVTENEIRYDEFNRWAEPLKDNFSRVLVANLSSLLQSNKIVRVTQNIGLQAPLQIAVDVVQFDGSLGGDAVLVARWGLFHEGGKKLLAADKFVFREPVGATTYEALVATQSRAVAALSREIAGAVRSRK